MEYLFQSGILLQFFHFDFINCPFSSKSKRNQRENQKGFQAQKLVVLRKNKYTPFDSLSSMFT